MSSVHCLILQVQVQDTETGQNTQTVVTEGLPGGGAVGGGERGGEEEAGAADLRELEAKGS